MGSHGTQLQQSRPNAFKNTSELHLYTLLWVMARDISMAKAISILDNEERAMQVRWAAMEFA
jgi:hypothetical protein